MRPVYILSFIVFILLTGCSNEDPPDPDPVITNQPPATPILLMPGDNIICTPNSLFFEWRAAVDPEGDNVSYLLEISTNQNFSENVMVQQILSTTSTITLGPGINYFWRVKAIDAGYNESNYSAIRKFITEPNTTFNSIPHQPEQVAPGNNVSIAGNPVLLKWTATHPDGDALRFDVYFGTENPPPLIKENFQINSIQLDVESNKTYYWKIVVKDPNDAKAIGEVWTFKS